MTIRLIASLSLIMASAALAAPPTIGEWEMRKRTADGMISHGLTLTDGQVIKLQSGVPAGLTLGGLAALSVVGSSEIADGSITDADISAGAGIAQSKISGLSVALALKANASHTHTPSSVQFSNANRLLGSPGSGPFLLGQEIVVNSPLSCFSGNLYLANGDRGDITVSDNGVTWTLDPLPAVLLGTSTDPDTIDPTDVGIGWADDKFTVQTPAGALQMYLAGDPEEATIYWPGRITADSIEAASLSASVDASQVDHGSIPAGVMYTSTTAPAREWQDSASYAGANGLTYANTGPMSQSEPSVPGTYFAAIEVTDGGTDTRNAIVGRIRTAGQMNVPVIVSVPATASSTGTAGQIAYDSSYLYICTATNTWKRVAIASW